MFSSGSDNQLDDGFFPKGDEHSSHSFRFKTAFCSKNTKYISLTNKKFVFKSKLENCQRSLFRSRRTLSAGAAFHYNKKYPALLKIF